MTDFCSRARRLRRVFLHDMVLNASIGIYPHEHAARQRVRINVDLAVEDETARRGRMVGADELRRVVDYEAIANRIRAIVGDGHVRLAETLAERIAQTCLQDRRVRTARVRVEKLDVFPDAVSAGVEVERGRTKTAAGR
ncbi:dihydroneopterin aldolase [Rhodopila sp.]|jgi:dihydroneopterin aldolase|uniref:dihydroneopterin aldolase n=1 Tax=Rhodopila sp. TaxID=2480087 RepID=UPI002B755301|nr:dihydroneopterin aldolase [Rhodopila sp.]HVZ06653.1 dihydroneopterin aldolase [Rhodopila sp.]